MKQINHHTLSLLDKKANIVVLSRGYTEDNLPYYAYILMSPSKYIEYRKINENGNFELTKYGNIIKFGRSIEPPQMVAEQIKREYGDNSYFENEIKPYI
ncbi:MAG: hypothetical protein R3D71_06615 [Rickettsiales bacterium]